MILDNQPVFGSCEHFFSECSYNFNVWLLFEMKLMFCFIMVWRIYNKMPDFIFYPYLRGHRRLKSQLTFFVQSWLVFIQVSCTLGKFVFMSHNIYQRRICECNEAKMVFSIFFIKEKQERVAAWFYFFECVVICSFELRKNFNNYGCLWRLSEYQSFILITANAFDNHVKVT